MANYLIVVPRGNTELFDLLSVAFRGLTGFHVVVDRRASASLAGPERRSSRITPGPDEIVVAERSERADRPGAGERAPRIHQRVPVRRRRVRAVPVRHAAHGSASAC
jgi:hypothetical protein